jgi:hypothetical protein
MPFFKSILISPPRSWTLLAQFLPTLAFLIAPAICNAQQGGQDPILQAGQQSGLQFLSQSSAANSPPDNLVSARPASFAATQHSCGHVIELLVANRFRQQAVQNRGELAPGLEFRSPEELSVGDLELVSVIGVADGDPTQGPAFDIIIRNHSRETVYDFRVSVVGVLHAINLQSPTSVVPVTEITSGSLLQVRVQLPSSAFTMETSGNVARGFDRVVVAVDSFDELVESDELNNVRILLRNQIPQSVSVVSQLPVAAPLTPTQTIPRGPDQQPQGPPDTAVPSPERGQSPLDSINPDDLMTDPALENK